MYLFRALDDYDLAADPLKNGLASKNIIYDITKSYYKDNAEFISLNENNRDLFIREHMLGYLNDNKYRIEKKYRQYSKEIINAITNIRRSGQYSDLEFMKIVYSLSTLNQHLLYGSNKFTNWISFSSKFSCVKNYYNSQKFHHVALIVSNTNGFIDDETLAIDLSNKETIINNKALCNKIAKDAYESFLGSDDIDSFIRMLVVPTKKNFRGYNFSSADKEFCYFQYVSSNQVVAVLDALQVDLIRCDLFNENFLKRSKSEQLFLYNQLKNKLLVCIKNLNDPYMLHVYQELYLNNKNIKYVAENIFEREKVEYNKRKILGIACKIPDAQIKRK